MLNEVWIHKCLESSRCHLFQAAFPFFSAWLPIHGQMPTSPPLSAFLAMLSFQYSVVSFSSLLPLSFTPLLGKRPRLHSTNPDFYDRHWCSDYADASTTMHVKKHLAAFRGAAKPLWGLLWLAAHPGTLPIATPLEACRAQGWQQGDT